MHNHLLLAALLKISQCIAMQRPKLKLGSGLRMEAEVKLTSGICLQPAANSQTSTQKVNMHNVDAEAIDVILICVESKVPELH